MHPVYIHTHIHICIQIVPELLENISDGSAEGDLSLLALRQLVEVRPRDMLEFLLPQLIVHPLQVRVRVCGIYV